MIRLFRRKKDAVQLKSNTEGTSNEITLSVLDATKDALDEESAGRKKSKGAGRVRLGVIRLFTLHGRKKSIKTPTKNKAILLEEDLREAGGVPSGGTTVTLPEDRPEGAGSAGAAVAGAPTRPALGKHVRTEASAAAAAGAWQPPIEEVTQRKSSRKRGKLIVGIIGGSFGAALVAVGIWMAYGYFSHQASLRDTLEEAIVTIDRADEPLMRLDEMIGAQMTLGAAVPAADAPEASPRDYEALEPQLAEAERLLGQAQSSIESIRESIGDARDLEVADDAIDAIYARRAMIDDGEALMDAVLTLRQAQRAGDDGWNAVLQGDAEAREAAELIRNTTVDNAHGSIDRSKAALASFERGRDEIAEAQQEAPKVDLSAYGAYINLRVEALNAAVAADEAYLARDRAASEEQNRRYNELDTQAADAAVALHGNPADLIGAHLVETMQPQVDAYNEQRQRAGAADGILRNYLDRIL